MMRSFAIFVACFLLGCAEQTVTLEVVVGGESTEFLVQIDGEADELATPERPAVVFTLGRAQLELNYFLTPLFSDGTVGEPFAVEVLACRDGLMSRGYSAEDVVKISISQTISGGKLILNGIRCWCSDGKGVFIRI